MPALKERAKTLVDLVRRQRRSSSRSGRSRSTRRPRALLDAGGASAARRPGGRACGDALDGDAIWRRRCARFAEAEGVKLGKVAQPLRAALTGSATSPPIFDVLVALGREESLARLADQAA